MNGEQAAAAPAADSPSIESRVSSLFGGPSIDRQPEKQQTQAQEPQGQHEPIEATDQAPAIEDATSGPPQGEDPTAPQYEEVEYEGKSYQVPPELKEAIIRQSDYTRKTQEVAETRKLLDHQQAQLRTAQLNAEFERAIQPQIHEIQNIDRQLAQYDALNWREIAAEDRTLHMLEMQRLEKLKAAKLTEVQGKQQEHQQKFHENLKKLQSDAQVLLKQRIPGWSEATAKEVSEWALTNGFTQEEVSSIYDPRHAEVLWKAAQYDKARSSAKPAVAQAKAVRTTSANPMPSHVKEMLNFKNKVKSTAPGSVERSKLVESRVGALFSKR